MMMKTNLVCDLFPKENNPRNSEGSFLRAPTGEILFAYSVYSGESWTDHAACDIKMIRSFDEGETWTEFPETIAPAAFFGTKNVMSVSACPLKDGSPAFYFLVKENDGSSTLARTVSKDGGKTFVPERPIWNVLSGYYVVNNDRVIRISDGRIVAPAAYYPSDAVKKGFYPPAVSVLLISEDDGASFYLSRNAFLSYSASINSRHGLQEPGIIELSPGIFWLWMRTGAGYQYQSYSMDNLNTFTPPEPSRFTSPDSPMEIERLDENTLVAVYNPIPNYNGREKTRWGAGRTPLVVRKSTDNGKTFGEFLVIEEDDDRGFCYPSVFFTKDHSMLCAYCRGGKEDGVCLARLGIIKVSLNEFE
jgi:hypothetical protein